MTAELKAPKAVSQRDFGLNAEALECHDFSVEDRNDVSKCEIKCQWKKVLNFKIFKY